MGIRITQVKLIDRLFLVGPPGIGKTEIIKSLAEQEAKSLGRVFVDLREATDEQIQQILREPSKYYVFLRVIAPHVFPEDLAIPRHDVVRNIVEMIPLKYWRVMSLSDIAGVLFIDELTNVQREDQLSMFFSILLEKEASYGIKLSNKIKIVSAGNPPEWSEVARALPKPIRAGRLSKVEVESPSVQEWVAYMNQRYGDGWDKRIGAVLMAMKELFLMKPDEDEMESIACPRSWTKLALDLYQYGSADGGFVEELIIGTVGKRAGNVVLSLLKANIDFMAEEKRLLANPSAWATYNTTAKILMAHYFANKSVDEQAKYLRLYEYLVNHDSEWLVMVIMMMPRQKRIQFLSRYKQLVQNLLKILTEYGVGQ